MATALMFAGGSVAAKRGLQSMAVMPGLLVSLVSTLAVTLVAVVADPPGTLPIMAIGLFATSGLLGDGVGRVAFLAGVHRLGPSTAIPLQTATYPLVVVFLGITLLSESTTAGQLAGVGAVVLGVWILTTSNEPSLDRTGSEDGRITALRRHRVAFLLPAAAGIVFGLSDVFRKEGLDQLASPVFGAAVAAAAALIAWLALIGASPRLRKQVRLGKGAGWFAVSGAFQGLGLLALFGALEAGNVSLVGPIVAAQPLAVVAFSALLLRDVEAVTRAIVIGCVLTVVGVVLVVSG